MTRLDEFLRMASRRMSRRQVGAFGAMLVALLSDTESADARKRKRNAKRDRPQQSREANRRRQCGGIAGLPCPDGFTCVDDPRDDCDPEAGGADCFGVCVRKTKDPCATVRCREGTRCCPECGRVCIPDDVPCANEVCARKPCNKAICGPGEYCCNVSCSLCVPLGHACTAEVCLPEDPSGERCGKVVCPRGQVCCNASCGFCTEPGMACIMIACPEDNAD